MTTEIRPCPYCKKPFTWTHLYPMKKFCTPKCREASYRASGKKKIWNKNCRTFTSEERLCKECGKPFMTKNHLHIYCRKKCTNKVMDRGAYHRKRKLNPVTVESGKERIRNWRKDHEEKGICARCTNKVVTGYKLCQECYDYLKGR